MAIISVAEPERRASGRYSGHRVRVMWERPTRIWRHKPLAWLHTRVPIYVFVAYRAGTEQPLRIGLRGDREKPFVIDDPFAYDGGLYKHGPYADASRYDAESKGLALAALFDLLLAATLEPSEESPDEAGVALESALDDFYAWVWNEHRRDRDMLPGTRYGL